jgi:hypothetical protein
LHFALLAFAWRLQRVAQTLARAELRHLGGLDLDRCTGTGVAAGAGGALGCVTLPPFFNVVFTAAMMASSERPAAALEMSAWLAMCSINSLLFTSLFPSQGVLVSTASPAS